MIQRIKESEVVILWGVDSSVEIIADDLKSKQVIVIDPVQTKFTKKAMLHVEIKPKGDMFFAVMLSRFLFISDMIDVDFLEKYASDYAEYEEFTQEFRIVLTLKKIGLDTGVIRNLLDMIVDKKVMIICGNGLAKYEELDEMKEVLTAFGMLLGLFDKDGCGIIHADSTGYKECFNLQDDEFEFIDEIDTDILKEM